MATDNEKTFRVVDRRASASSSEETKKQEGTSSEHAKETIGAGFVMKDVEILSEKDSSTGLEQIDFSTLVFSLATQAHVHLGLVPDPNSEKKEKNLPFAKNNIDILCILKDKTQGNLSDDESKLLNNLLTELRLLYVQASR